MAAEYMVSTTAEFLKNLENVHRQLSSFSQKLSEKREDVFEKLNEFEAFSQELSEKNKPKSTKVNVVDREVSGAIDFIAEVIRDWHTEIEKNRKGTEFMKKHEKYLVVMAFGAVKAGKSRLGNFFAGREFRKADFDNAYKGMEPAVFAMEEKGRENGNFEPDEKGETWFKEGVIDTTGSIQYFTLSGLRWMDTPGLNSTQKEGDHRNMDEMVNEYIEYADLCVFLMNSSEPGLLEDMKYISKLSREGQEAIVVITKSDRVDEDEDEEGNLITTWQPKTEEARKGQEDYICNMLQETYPDVPTNRYSAISISSLLAGEGIKKQDETMYRGSHLDLLMGAIAKKASGELVALKKEKPKKNLNRFIDRILHGDEECSGIDELDKVLTGILAPIEDYKQTIGKKEKMITNRICNQIRRDVEELFDQMESQVERNERTIEGDLIHKKIDSIICDDMYDGLNKEIGNIISGFQTQNQTVISSSLQIGDLRKKYETQRQSYERVELVERDPSGFWENVKSFFGKKYYRKKKVVDYIDTQVDCGNNAADLLDSIEPQVHEYVVRYVNRELKRIRDSYFVPQERYVKEMQKRISSLRAEMEGFKY